ncbi:class I SAM-dependent methyltransferase [Thiofilum flexile]|uniref:class I SAM-dependent methyltransferase n=1 Tax=Thiofilum flexile TaxID=125627 RepID=UPI00037E1C30|nr:class I SAM-dependent methyltransferase [Thiofilum flexile]
MKQQENAALASIDLSANHSHAQIVRRVPRYARVLELGCAGGEMSELLKSMCQASIIGFDKNPQLAWRAQRFCDYVFTEDLDDPHSLDALEGEKFDVVTLTDVLEHLQHPESLLERIKPLLLDEGEVLISVPNVAHASIRLELLAGNFAYEKAGILDETHLHFFTLDSLRTLIQQCGYTITDMDCTWNDMADNVIAEYLAKMNLEATPEALAKFHEPEAMAYQFILTLRLSSPEQGDDLLGRTQLKPLLDSNLAWGRMQNQLKTQAQMIRGLEIQLENCTNQLQQLTQDYQRTRAELAEVHATRSWQWVRRASNLWRGTLN